MGLHVECAMKKGRVQEPSQSQGSIRRREQNLLGKFSFRPPILPEHITASSTDTEQRPKRPQRQGLEAQRSHRKRTQDYMSALEDEVLRLRADRAKLSEIAENWKRCTAALVGARRQTSLDDHGAVRFELGSFLWLVSSPSSDGRSLPQMNEHLWPPWERHVPLSMSVLSQLGFREWEFTLLQNFCENIIPTLDLTERSVDGYAKHFMPLAFSNKMVMCSVLAASASHLQMAGAAKMAVGRLQYRSRAFASLQQAENQLAGDPLICLMALATIMGLLIDDMIGGNREHATLLKLADFWVSVKCPRGEKSDNRITHVFLKEQLQLLRTLVYPLYQFKMITSTESGASGASRSVGSFDSMGLCQMFSSLEKAMAQACQIYNFPPTANSSLHSHEMDQSSEALSTLLDQLVQTVRNIPPYALGENSLAWVYYVAASRSTQMDHSAFFTSRLVDLLHRMGYNDVKESVAAANVMQGGDIMSRYGISTGF